MTETSSSVPRMIRFGIFEVDLQAGELRRKGQKLKLQEQPFQVLALLLERPGEVVTREALREKLWPADTFVEFDHSLNTAISKIREALGDLADNPRFVETLPRRGYRFIASVETAEQAVSEPRARLRPRWVGALAVVALLAVLTGLNVGGVRDWLLGRPAPGEITSIAVLPLENLSGDPEQEYFVDGMTETLITELSKIGALTVISRQSVMQFKGTEKSLPEIARELNVDAVVEGSALHIGERVRITVQLIEAATDRNLWAENYDRELTDILALHSDVARAIAREVQITLTSEEKTRLAAARPVNPEAHEAYLKGRYHWNKFTEEGLEKAIQYYQQAISIEPRYSDAYVGLASAYFSVGIGHGTLPPQGAFLKAKQALKKALEIDSAHAEAHGELAKIHYIYDWDWAKSEEEFRAALELKSGSASIHKGFAFYLLAVGRHQEAIAEMRKAQELDPVSLIINADVAVNLYFARQFDQAITQMQKTIEMDANFPPALGMLGLFYVQEGMFEEAVASCEKAVLMSHGNTQWLATLGYVYGVAGKTRQAREILEKLAKRSQRESVGAIYFAWLHQGLGGNDQAVEWLEKAYQELSDELPYIATDPQYDTLRSDPRFQSLLRRMNFPE